MNERVFNANKERIKSILKKAKKTLFYSEMFEAIDLDIENLTYREFCRIPLLTKDIYKDNIFNMLSKDIDIRNLGKIESLAEKRKILEDHGMLLKITSGSTGKPIEVIKTQRDYTQDYLMLNYYRRKWSSYSFKGKFLWIWPVNPIIRKFLYSDAEEDRLIEINEYGEQYMLYEHSDENFESICNIIVKDNIEWITSSPSVLAELCDYMRRNSIIIKNIKYIESHSEFLYEWQRKKIIDVFGINPISIYSSNSVYC